MTHTLIELATMDRPGQELHPAWRAILDLRPRMCGVQIWHRGAKRDPGMCWDWEVALAMIVRGYGADVVKCVEVDGWSRYLLPPLFVPLAAEEEYMAVDPAIAPETLLSYYRRTIRGAMEAANVCD